MRKKAEIQAIRRLQLYWNPQPSTKPIVPADLHLLNPIGRGSEVIRFNVQRLEHWLSPSGALREWLRLNLLAGLCLSIPALILVPTVTYLLTQFVTWTALLVEIMKNLLIFPILAVVFLALMSGAILFVKAMIAGRG